MRLLHKAAARLRGNRLWTRRLDVQIEMKNARPYSAWTALNPCQDTLTLLEAFDKLYHPTPGTPIRAGVVLGKGVHGLMGVAPLRISYSNIPDPSQFAQL